MKLFAILAILSIVTLVNSKPAAKREVNTADDGSKNISSLTKIITTIKDFINKLKNPTTNTRVARDIFTNVFRTSIEASLDSKFKEELFSLSNKLTKLLDSISRFNNKTSQNTVESLVNANALIVSLDADDKAKLANLASKLKTIVDFVNKLKNQKSRFVRTAVPVDFEKLPPFFNITFPEHVFRDVVRIYGYLNNLQKSGIKFA
jgi:hypothetical protein